MFYHYGIYVLDFLEENLHTPEDITPGIGWMSYRLIGTEFVMVRTGVDLRNPKEIRWYRHSAARQITVYTMLWERDRASFDEVFDSVSNELKMKMIPHLELLSR